MTKTRKTMQTWSPESEARYTQRRIERADVGNQPTLTEFAQWLADSRELSPGTITLRIGSASTFVDAVTSRAGCSCARAFRSITVQQIEEFFVEHSKDHGMSSRHSMRTAMRSPAAISTMVGARTRRCGLPSHPHAFRHAFATRLLRAGQPVKAIADLLGHRSLDAVAIYAKVDFARLIEAAVEWPEVAS